MQLNLPSHGGTVKVTADFNIDRSIEIQIIDSGIGIPPI